jgi:hypothetical protein
VAFKVNISEQEAKSADREALPAGKFHFKITDMSLEHTKVTAKNPNMPYFNFEFTVQDSPGPWQQYAGRKDFTNAMLFPNALYTISQILKALDYPVPQGGELEIPDAPEFYLGKDIMGRRGTNQKDKVDDGTGKMILRVQLRGFSKFGPNETGGAVVTSGSPTGAGSVLP